MARINRSQQGATLIEVLVAMLVVSFGILALTGMLAAASRFGKTSEFRAVATLLASDITDRMRANKVAIADYQLLDGYDPPDKPPVIPGCDKPLECTPTELADIDMAEWATAMFYSLPGAQGYVAIDGSNNPPSAADVWVAWLDPSASENEPDAGAKECPGPFQKQNPQPRCMYFRVGL